MPTEAADEKEHAPEPREEEGTPPATAHAEAEHGGEHADSGERAGTGKGGQKARRQKKDPYWWTPYAVLVTLMAIGLLGVSGVFNKGARPGAPAASPGASTHKPRRHRPSPSASPSDSTPRKSFRAKHVLVQYKGSAGAPPTMTRTEAEAKERATEVMTKARGGASFEDLVKEYSDELGATTRGGDFGKVVTGEGPPQFAKALDKVQVGEVTEVVKGPFGYHVLLRTE